MLMLIAFGLTLYIYIDKSLGKRREYSILAICIIGAMLSFIRAFTGGGDQIDVITGLAIASLFIGYGIRRYYVQSRQVR